MNFLDGFVVFGKAHSCSASFARILDTVALKTVLVLVLLSI